VGYSFHHLNDVYPMLNLNAKRTIQIRYVFCLRKGYNDGLNNISSSNCDDKDDDIGDSMEEYVKLNTKEISIEKNEVTQELNQKIKRKVYREFKQSESSCILNSTRIANDIKQGMDILLDQADIALFSVATQFEPTIFKKSGNHNDTKDIGK
jgi:hypothetical protein